MPTVSANGIALNYMVEGPDGAPWITFSNSLATNITMWDDQAALLSREWRVLRYDQRGHGGTEVTAPPYSFDMLAEDVVALWDELGVKRSVFCGLSMGGTTGVGLAIDHDDRLSAFVGCDLRYDSDAAFTRAWDDRIAMARENGMAGMAGPTTGRWFTEAFANNPANAATMAKINGMVASTPLDGFIGCANALQNIGYGDKLDRINVPTLFMCGEYDPAANAAYMGPMKNAVAGSELVVVPDAGHISNMENPAAFNAGLVDFLRRL
ncbi:MAG: alpha/beta fold hydrolase [Proteobacteria bacterium]|nr:alpha/beta fold hydrolase [Pseudomonadota bacterium]